MKLQTFAIILISIVHLLIPILIALNAKKKGKNFYLWLIYGLILWPIALIHIIVLRNENSVIEKKYNTMIKNHNEYLNSNSASSKLLMYKELLDKGLITQNQFNELKKETFKNL